ncbi:hypothetical protein B0J13DRAFT_625552 [Dactylonectria estremocensis]|uniref:NmrA-like domain-containing protein n=1 Tax=Dactylonectria estremocensis TaxID=1079267 RepID=A0A9P9IX50_9HYPO|nr:hypothetical protein B0J13DRAFT_625552 [Dactylonectria estremocensis]
MDAAIAAKVPRYIPSEFGIDTRKYRNLKISSLLMPKIRNTFNHAYHSIQPQLRKYYVVNSGDEPFSTSTMSFVGQAIASVLKKPAEMANKYLNVAGMITTQNEIIRAVGEVTGSKFEISYLKSADLEKIADKKMAKNDHSGFMEYLQQFVFANGMGYAPAPKDSANGLLKLEYEDLPEAVKKCLP